MGEPSGGHVWILLVDDDGDTREALGEVLRDAGYNVREAASGAAALRLLGHVRPALVLTDVLMPDMDGDELRARAQASLKGLPFVFITGAHPARLSGLDGTVIPKPVDIEHLLAVVARHCADASAPPP